MYLRKTDVEMTDSLLQLGQSESTFFYSVEKTANDFNLEGPDNRLFTLYISQDATVDHYQRRVYSVFDLTGQLGGLYEVFEILGAFIVGGLAKKVFMYSLFNKLYYTEHNQNNSKRKNQNQLYTGVLPKTTLEREINVKTEKFKAHSYGIYLNTKSNIISNNSEIGGASK